MGEFEWDEEKDKLNRKKHGISFAEAATIFDGPVLTGADEGHHDEYREKSFGFLGGTVVTCVVHTERGEKTRIISARKATKKERGLFNAYLEKALS